jgi:hypothetical protein
MCSPGLKILVCLVAFPEPRLTGRIFHTAQTIGKPSKMGVRKEKILTSLIEKKITQLSVV